MGSHQTSVQVGQVWQDCDKRMNGRRVTVVEITDTHAIVESVVGQRTKIRKDRMRPTSTGFRLVHDPGLVACPRCGGKGTVRA